jgi:hypothetical protein
LRAVLKTRRKSAPKLDWHGGCSNSRANPESRRRTAWRQISQVKKEEVTMKVSSRGHLAGFALFLCGSSVLVAAEDPIAGTNPSQRPVGAPVITEVDHPGSWYTAALHGVSQPYPYSLRFLEDQGNWYTPFNRPGMPGWYDIRGWHQ